MTFDELLQASGGESVGGKIVARIEGVLVELGHKMGHVFHLTDAGRKFADGVVTTDAPAAPAVEAPAVEAPADPAPVKVKKDKAADTPAADSVDALLGE